MGSISVTALSPCPMPFRRTPRVSTMTQQPNNFWQPSGMPPPWSLPPPLLPPGALPPRIPPVMPPSSTPPGAGGHAPPSSGTPGSGHPGHRHSHPHPFPLYGMPHSGTSEMQLAYHGPHGLGHARPPDSGGAAITSTTTWNA